MATGSSGGYGGYMVAASSSLLNMAGQAASAAGSVAGQVQNMGASVRDGVASVCQDVAGAASQRLLSYKYEGNRNTNMVEEQPEYPETDSPVWLLGRQYSARYDLAELRHLVTSRPWLTYRKDFPAIGASGLTSDQGWGCMLRCGQMVLAGALLDIRLGSEWRWERGPQNDEYLEVMDRFRDIKSAQYSIHQIALMGESVERKPVGTWFGPNTVAQVLRKLCLYDPSEDIAVHVAMDNTLVINEVRESCLKPAKNEGEESSWKPLLLFISLRLGLSDINPVYIPGLKASFMLPASLGVIGGRPNHALYFLGHVEDEFVFLDPHTTQPATPEQVEEGEVHEEEDASYHCPRPGRISIGQLDPSLSLAFVCRTEQEFDNLCIGIQEEVLKQSYAPLFEMVVERPAHMYGGVGNSTDCKVTPDESTGEDYEQVARKYDSEDEFEIL